MASVVFCGSGRLGEIVLDALFASRHRVVGAVTAPPARRGRMGKGADLPVALLASARGLPLLRPERWDEGVSAWVAHLRPDALCVADFGLRVPVRDLPPAFNVHPSLLPRWRGAAPVPRAILAGDTVSGVSVIRMVDAMDAGPILAQERTPIGDDEDAGALLDRLAGIGGRLLSDVLDAFEEDALFPREQPPGEVTLAPRLRPGEERMDPGALTVDEIRRRVRAFAPRPGLKVAMAGEEVALLAVRPAAAAVPPGEVRASGGQLLLGARDGAVEVLRVRPAGRRAMSGRDFANGLSSKGHR